ncbi:MAG: twin-arginine translocation signal domain-containing protein, partial [Bacteroidetes bacterium]
MSHTDPIVQETDLTYRQYLTRRHFLRQCSTGLGAMALGSLLACG